MTTHPWADDTLDVFVADVWNRTTADLLRELRITRPTFEALLGGQHAREPVKLLELLHRALSPQLRKLGFGVNVEDVRAMWRRSVAARE